jgi:tRNA pseudouridine55 synthase
MAASPTLREPIDGVLLLDKPSGISSNAALLAAKRHLQASKAGHTGTLDPLASGLMALTFGEATKFSSDLLGADKCYEAQLVLGATTTTGDAEGEVTGVRPVAVSREQFETVLPSLTGELQQVPPMHSALKMHGRPLYRLARRGIEVERKPRTVRVLRLWLLQWDPARPTIGIESGKGLYVRTLAEDLGRMLGCGAHLGALKRTRVGGFGLSEAIGLDRLAQMPLQARRERLLPVDALLQDLPRVELNDEASRRLGAGQTVVCPIDSAPRARVYGPCGRLLGVASVEQGIVTAHRLISQARALDPYQ